MTPEEMRARLYDEELSGAQVTIWLATAEICERLDEIKEKLK